MAPLTDGNVFQCACRFTRKDEFSKAELIEPCGFHACMQKDLDAARQELATVVALMEIMMPKEPK